MAWFRRVKPRVEALTDEELERRSKQIGVEGEQAELDLRKRIANGALALMVIQIFIANGVLCLVRRHASLGHSDACNYRMDDGDSHSGRQRGSRRHELPVPGALTPPTSLARAFGERPLSFRLDPNARRAPQ